ncbi:MAG TPA: cysteine desulfurase family protein [Candidatus Saccharimonadales bacterium]|nr:cysteine desulfurase family protein [Candidatus Saccharimonadales bacterium]
MKRIYLDYAAATPMGLEVVKAMEPYFSERFYNPSAVYLGSRRIRQDLDKARAKIAMWLGASKFEIYFTAGATEANNLAVQGIMRNFPDSEILVSSIEHASVLAPAGLFKNRRIPVNRQGDVELKALRDLLTSKTVLVSVMMVNNELGTVQPIKEISALIRDIRQERRKSGNSRPLYLHTDAAQAGNLFDLHTHRLGVDLMSINGGKIYGPKQSGILFVKSGIEIKPLVVGGGQESNLRSGTENVAAAIGLSKALDLAQKKHAKEFRRLTELRTQFIGELAEKVPAAVINGSKKHQSPQMVSVTLPGFDNERLTMELDELGIECAVGSACSASSDEPSHVLTAIGLSEKEAQATLRFSFGNETTKVSLKKVVAALAHLTAVNR